MKTKSYGLFILFAGLLLLNSCNGLSPTNYEKFPPGADFEKVFNAMKGNMKDNPQFYEMKGTFRINSANSTPPAYMEITYIPENNEDTFYEYTYNMVDAHWAGPQQVTLHEGNTSGRKLDRNEFSDVLFKREDMPDFSLFDSMYEKALEAAAMGADGYVVGFDMNKFEGEDNFFITVSTKDMKTKKAVFFDKTGNMLRTDDL
jgi:hypothetical protein